MIEFSHIIVLIKSTYENIYNKPDDLSSTVYSIHNTIMSVLVLFYE